MGQAESELVAPETQLRRISPISPTEKAIRGSDILWPESQGN